MAGKTRLKKKRKKKEWSGGEGWRRKTERWKRERKAHKDKRVKKERQVKKKKDSR